MEYMRYIFLILFLFFFTSCTNTKKEQMSSLIQEWNGKTIQFPKHLVFTRFATDTIDYNIAKSNYKIVVYVDTVGCISCKLQLPRWKNFITQIDSICNENISFLFFFQPGSTKELRNILYRDDFDFPICVDVNEEFNKLNNIPNEMMFQTFLIDSDNKVKLIGNPIHNVSVRELYLNEVSKTTSVSNPLTFIEADSIEYRLGVLKQGEIKKQTIYLSNTGKETFYLKGITTSCNCVSAECSWKEIVMGNMEKIIICCNAEELGTYSRELKIYGNIPNECITIHLIGEVK